MTTLRARFGRLFQPRKVSVQLPREFEGARRLNLWTERGRDRIALEIAAGGWDSFERPLPALIACAARRVTGAFFDVGANTGLYALLAACASHKIRIHAFEPYPPAIEALERNIALNGFDDRISICRFALGDAPERKPLYIPLQNHGLMESSASLNAEFKQAHSDVLRIDVTTIDHYVSAQQPLRLGLLKIDVESTEHEVLAGGLATISRDRPVVLLEVLHLADHARLDAFCREQRYRIFTLHADRIKARSSVQFHGDAWNQCFCPLEKLPLLAECAKASGLQIDG